jgi:hypothetical protein
MKFVILFLCTFLLSCSNSDEKKEILVRGDTTNREAYLKDEEEIRQGFKAYAQYKDPIQKTTTYIDTSYLKQNKMHWFYFKTIIHHTLLNNAIENVFMVRFITSTHNLRYIQIEADTNRYVYLSTAKQFVGFTPIKHDSIFECSCPITDKNFFNAFIDAKNVQFSLGINPKKIIETRILKEGDIVSVRNSIKILRTLHNW